MRALVILNGEIDLPNRKGYELVLCCDGAYNRTGDYPVDYFVGDGDSVEREVTVPKINLEQSKNYTDGEFATRLAIERGAVEIDFAGALGGERFDQVLANFILLNICYEANVKARILDRTCSVCLLHGKETYDSRGIRYVSLVPLMERAHILRAEGLLYPIYDLTLNPTDTIGVSNEPSADEILLDVDEGKVLVVFHYSLPR